MVKATIATASATSNATTAARWTLIRPEAMRPRRKAAGSAAMRVERTALPNGS
jgi:hypothetical protein